MNLDSIKDNNNINFFVKNKELGLTISTTEGLINNIEFKEQDIIKDLHTDNCIIRIESNFGDIITSDIYEEILKSKIKPKIGKTRGRKPYVKISKNTTPAPQPTPTIVTGDKLSFIGMLTGYKV